MSLPLRLTQLFCFVMAAVACAGCATSHSDPGPAGTRTYRLVGQTTRFIYVNGIQVQGMVYMPVHWHSRSFDPTTLLSVGEVGRRIGVVEAYPSSELTVYATDRFAYLVPVGTPLFQVLGEPATFEIAVRVSRGRYFGAQVSLPYCSLNAVPWSSASWSTLPPPTLPCTNTIQNANGLSFTQWSP